MDQGSYVPLANCSFEMMIPLSRHSVDRSPRAFHSSTHNVVRAYCFETASFESIKLFRDGTCAWQGVGHGVDVSGHLLGGSDLRWRQPFGVCGEGLYPPVHTSRVLG